MNSEQKQTREFFEKLTKNETYTTGCWVLVGVCTLIFVMIFFLPVQELLADVEGSMYLIILMIMCGPMAAYFRILPYHAYGTQPNRRKMAKIINYHPVNPMEKKKMEVSYTIRYMAKVTLVCMVIQLLISGFAYGEITWINIVYVLVIAFVYPVVLNICSIYFDN